MGGSTKLMSSGAGGVILTTPGSIAADVTVNLPTQNSTLAINGPAFSAYLPTASQSVSSGVWTKATCSAEEFDTNSNFDTSNYRFTPTVAGYYQISGGMYTAGASITLAGIAIYKNSSEHKLGNILGFPETAQSEFIVSSLVYLNGTTDYVELYGFISASSGASFNFGSAKTYFQGALVRAA